MSCLTQLSFTLSATSPAEITPSHAPLRFSKLQTLELFCDSWVSISNLLARVQLPVITIFFFVETHSCPSKQDMAIFCATLQTPSIGDSTTRFRVNQRRHSLVTRGTDPPVLAFDDLRPSMAFRDLRQIELNLEWSVCLTGRWHRHGPTWNICASTRVGGGEPRAGLRQASSYASCRRVAR